MQTNEGITLSTRDDELIATCRPAANQRPVDPRAVQQQLVDAGYGHWALFPDAVIKLAERWSAGGEEFEIPVGRCEDAHFTVEVASDGLSAFLKLTAAKGGQPPKLEDIQQAVKEAGVVFGLDQAVLQQACNSTVDKRVQIAAAQPPVDGEATRFELLVEDTRNRQPKVDENGLIDYHELGDIPTVKAGQALMRRHPPTKGSDGHDVRGQLLHATPGLDEPFDTPLHGVALAKDDANLLVAAEPGQPVHTRCGVNVEKVLDLKSVNMATGNIHFTGTVEINGDVAPGMKVEASGDIIVKGMVEGAKLDAKGSVKVEGGVISHATVNAGVSVEAKFVENSTINAGTAIVIETMALHSDLQALNQVLVGSETAKRSRLIGGSTRATMLVRTPTLGATAGGVTKIQVGVNPAFHARYQDLEKEIELKQAEADKLEKVMHHLEQHGDPRQMLDKVRPAWQLQLKEWGRLLEEKTALDHELALTQNARVEITDEVAGDVDMVFGKVMRHLRSSFGAGAFHVDEQGQVVFSPSGGGHDKPV